MSTSENCYGITYDAARNEIYWSTEHKIHRANAAYGTELETVLNTTQLSNLLGETIACFEFCMLLKQLYILGLQMEGHRVWLWQLTG